MRMLMACGAALMLTASVALVQPEPTRDGKTLSEWVRLMNQNPGDHEATLTLGKMGEAAIPALIQAMRTHPDGAIRWLTHEALAEIGRPALPELDRVMQDGDATAQMQAALSFEKILGAEAIPRLRAALQAPYPQPRVRAHGALLRLGDAPEEHRRALTDALLDPQLGVQWIAAEALGMCGKAAAGTEAALYEATQRFPGGIAERAWVALREIGTEAAMVHVNERIAAVIADAKVPRGERLKEIVALGQSGQGAQKQLPALRALADDRAQEVLVRGYAAWAADQISPARRKTGRTYHVAQAHPRADDANPGTRDRPWKTVQRAAETLRAGDTVLIHTGVYREFVQPFCGGRGAEHPVTYAAAPGETPVLTGSDPWVTDWRDEGGGLWSTPYERHPWDHPEQWPEPNEGPMHRAEQVFVEGVLLRHVATMDELKGEPGRMLTDDEGKRLWIHLAAGEAPSSKAIERSMRQQVFAPAVRGLGYLHVRGLTMRNAAAPESNGANWAIIAHRAVMSTRAGHHWVIEDNVVEWGNAQGMDIGGEGWGSDIADQPKVCEKSGYHQVRRNRVNHHGVAGIVGWGGGENELLLEDNETSFNCLKGNFFAYEAAGVKLHNAKDCLIRRHRSHANETFGIWLDYQCERNRITQCLLTENRGAGVFHEVSAGPILIDSNVILGTRNAGDAWGEGIYSHDGNHALCVNNYIADCANFGVRFRNLFSRVADGKPTTTSHNLIANNLIVNCARGAVSLNPEVPKAEDNHSNGNILWQAGGAVGMYLEDSGSGVTWGETAIGRALGWSGGGDHAVPLQQWQELLGEDRGSRVLAPDTLLGRRSPEEILNILRAIWPHTAPPLEAGYGEVTARPVGEMVEAIEAATAPK